MKSIVVILLVVLGVFLAGCGVQEFNGYSSPQVTCHVNSNTKRVNVGDSVIFSATATKGSGIYKTWMFNSGEEQLLDKQQEDINAGQHTMKDGIINYKYTKPGVFTPSVTVTDDSGNKGVGTCPKITVTKINLDPYQPDLSVKINSHRVIPQGVNGDSNYLVTMTITNNGTANVFVPGTFNLATVYRCLTKACTSSTNIALGSISRTDFKLAKDASAVVKFITTKPLNKNLLVGGTGLVVVDPDNKIAESNEGNNQLKQSITAADVGADLCGNNKLDAGEDCDLVNNKVAYPKDISLCAEKGLVISCRNCVVATKPGCIYDD